MTHLGKREFHAWAYDDLLANTTRGVLAEFIVATALGVDNTPRVEWDNHDLNVDGFGVEVKSAAYVQSWAQTRPSTIAFDIRPTKGCDAVTNVYAPIAQRSAEVYVFCLLNGTDRSHIDPLDVTQWTFYVLPTGVLNQRVPTQKTIRLGSLMALEPSEATYDNLKNAIHIAASSLSPSLSPSSPVSVG